VCLDTGSDDKSPEIAKKYADKFDVMDFGDDFHFAKARDRTVEMSTQRFFMYVDADEWFEDPELANRVLSHELEDKKGHIYSIRIRNVNKDWERTSDFTSPRLFDNVDRDLFFINKVHNKGCLPKSKNAVVDISQVVLRHDGYSMATPELQKIKIRKSEERIKVAKEEVKKNPDDIFWLEYYVNYCVVLKRWHEAYKNIRHIYEVFHRLKEGQKDDPVVKRSMLHLSGEAYPHIIINIDMDNENDNLKKEYCNQMQDIVRRYPNGIDVYYYLCGFSAHMKNWNNFKYWSNQYKACYDRYKNDLYEMWYSMAVVSHNNQLDIIHTMEGDMHLDHGNLQMAEQNFIQAMQINNENKLARNKFLQIGNIIAQNIREDRIKTVKELGVDLSDLEKKEVPRETT
jgi:glycosyltransferase involved in cell wall biosynthesis